MVEPLDLFNMDATSRVEDAAARLINNFTGSWCFCINTYSMHEHKWPPGGILWAAYSLSRYRSFPAFKRIKLKEYLFNVYLFIDVEQKLRKGSALSWFITWSIYLEIRPWLAEDHLLPLLSSGMVISRMAQDDGFVLGAGREKCFMFYVCSQKYFFVYLLPCSGNRYGTSPESFIRSLLALYMMRNILILTP